MKSYAKKYERIADELLLVDKKYQRHLSDSRAKRIAKEFDPRGVGFITVSKRTDGHYYILDGQHRFTAMKILGVKHIDCIVFEGMTQEDEAQAFNYYNNIKNINRLERGKALTIAKDPSALKIEQVVQNHGHKIDYEKTGNGIQAYSTLEKIYRAGGEEGISQVLEVINKAFTGEKAALGKDVILGLHGFIAEYKGRYDEKSLIKRLQKITVEGVLSRARILSHAHSCEKYKGVKMAVIEAYDYGKKEKLKEI